MPKRAMNPFESQRKKFEATTSKDLIGRVAVLRSLTNLEAMATDQAGTDSLSNDDFAELMNSSYGVVLELNDNGSVKPPLTEKQRQDLIAKRAIYNVFLSKDKGGEKVSAKPTSVKKIDTAKRKS